MKSTKLKKVITDDGSVVFYLGDGENYNRISDSDAFIGLENGNFTLHETVDYKGTGFYIESEYDFISLEQMEKLAKPEEVKIN